MMLWPYGGNLPSGVYIGFGNEFGAPRDSGAREHEGIDIHTRPQDPIPTRAGVTGKATYTVTRDEILPNGERLRGGYVDIDEGIVSKSGERVKLSE
jgi:hypothetical protein